MDWKNVKGTDYSKIDQFNRIGYRYRKIGESEKFILWQVDKTTKTWNSKWDKFELWKKKIRKQPDGSNYIAAPSDAEGGTYYWFFNNAEDFSFALQSFPEETHNFLNLPVFLC